MKTKYNIKVKFNEHWMEYTNVDFIDSLESYKKYMIEFNNKFTVSESEIKNLKTFIGHGHSMITGISGMTCGMIHEKEKRGPMLFNLKLLHATVLSDQLKHILNGDKLVINKNGGYFAITNNQEYEVVKIDGDNYIEKDIKVKRWFGGKHYYAKVGNVDVIDDYGNVKWKTEKRARESAVKFINELNTN